MRCRRTITESRRDEHRECVHAKVPVRHGYKLTTAKGYREEKPRKETIRPPAEERSQTWIQGGKGKREKTPSLQSFPVVSVPISDFSFRSIPRPH
jgi:hypothetical protein